MVMFLPKLSGVPNCITQQILAINTFLANSWGNVLEPMVVTCNIGSVQHLVGEEQIRFICATRSEGRSARSTAVYTKHGLVPLPACIENS